MSGGRDAGLVISERAGVVAAAAAALKLPCVGKCVSVPTAAATDELIGSVGHGFERADVPLAKPRCPFRTVTARRLGSFAATISISSVTKITTVLATETQLGWPDVT